jgi:hypothetical protein
MSRILEDLEAENLSEIVPKVHKKLLKKALLQRRSRSFSSFNLTFLMKALGIATLTLFMFSLFSPGQSFAPELKTLVAKAHQSAEEKAQQGRYYHQKYIYSYPVPPDHKNMEKSRTQATEMIETWADTESNDFIVLNKDMKTGETHGSMGKNGTYYLFDVKNDHLDLRPQGPLIKDKRIFNPTMHLDYGKTVGQALKDVIDGKKSAASIKELFPYSDIFNPKYIGIHEINKVKMEGLSLEGASPGHTVDFFFDAKTFELKLVKSQAMGAKKGYTDKKTGEFIEVQEDLFTEQKYLSSEYTNTKPAVTIGGQTLSI